MSDTNYSRRVTGRVIEQNPDYPVNSSDYNLSTCEFRPLSADNIQRGTSILVSTDEHTQNESRYTKAYAYAAAGSVYTGVSIETSTYQHNADLTHTDERIEVTRYDSGEYVVNLHGFSNFRVERLESGVIQITPIK